MGFLSDTLSKAVKQRTVVNQGGHPNLPSGVLMRWTETNVTTALYQRKRQGAFYFIWPFLPLSVFIIVLLCYPHAIEHPLTFIFFAIMLVFGFVVILFRQLPSCQIDELSEDGINQRINDPGGGGSFFSSPYKNIECCIVRRDSFKGMRFAVLKIKNKHKLFKVVITGPVTTALVPEDTDLDSILKILRDKGVRAVEEPSA